MKKYKNITSSTLSIDCFTRTIYVQPGEEIMLPYTRDVKYYSQLKMLVPVKERKKDEKKHKKYSNRPRRSKKRFKKSKEEFKKIEEEKIENNEKENGDN